MLDKIEHLAVAVQSADVQRAEIQRSLGRLEGKVDLILEGIKEHEERDEARFENIEKRVALVERKIWYATGIGAALAFILSKLNSTGFGIH